MIAPGTISIAKARLEGDIVHCIKRWAMSHPLELVRFDRLMRGERDFLDNENGTSREGSLKKIGEVPVSLSNMMGRRFGHDWMYQRTVRDLFWSHFIVGKIYQYTRLGKV